MSPVGANLPVKVLSLWDAREIYDEMGNDRSIGLFEDECSAQRAIIGRGGYAGDGRVKAVELRIYPSFEAWKDDEAEKAKASGLKKLTREERAALGLGSP
jgi:hypothetical protein